jgi:ArsR family transcriptional regulator
MTGIVAKRSRSPKQSAKAATIDDLDSVFKGFADPTRIRILSVLAAGELCVCDIVELLDLPQPLVSRHLAYLRRTGLVSATRGAKFAYYRLANPTHAVHQNLIACVRSCFQGVESLDRERSKAEARVRAREAEPC